MSTTSEQLGKQAREVTEDVQKMGGILRNAAQEKLEQAGETAADYFKQGQEKVQGVACACEEYLREKPLTSILIAAGIGWLLGRYWKRR
jgi:ElaB/YqjD/DUF883 family membrane-anchored ribosome-binding protein